MTKSIINIFRLWKIEIKRIIHNPIAMLLFVAILILPSLYAWVNIKALWDPYSNTGSLKVAVATQDQAVSVLNLKNKKINVGVELIKNLKKNDQLNWQFVSCQEAKSGVKSGKYYAGIILPANFSKDLLSITTGKIKKPAIIYLVNDKINPIAPKVTDQGLNGLEGQINAKFTKEVAISLLNVFHQVGINTKKNWQGINQAKEMLLKADDNLDQIDQATKKVLDLEGKIPEIDQKLAKVNGLTQLLPQINQAGKKIVDLNNKMPDLMQKAQLIEVVQGKIPEINEAAQNIAMLDGDLGTITSTMDTASAELQRVANIVQIAQENLPLIDRMEVGANQVLDFSEQSVLKVEAGLNQLGTLLRNNWQIIKTAVDTLDDFVNQVPDQITSEQLDQLKNQVQMVAKVVDQVKSLVQMLLNADPNNQILQNLWQQLQDQENLWQNLLSQLNQVTPENYSTHVAEIKNLLGTIRGRVDSFNLEQLIATVDQTIAQIKEILASGRYLLGQVQAINLANLFQEAMTTITTAQSLLQKYQEKMPEITTEVHDANNLLNGHLGEIIDGINTGAELYQTKASVIASKVAGMANFYQNDWPTLQQELTSTLDLANQKWPNLKNAVSIGADFIHQDWPNLKQGIKKSASLIRQTDGKVDFAKLAQLLQPNASTQSEFLANPITIKSQTYYDEPNYGSQNTPFYTVLCFWVGGLLFSSLATTKYHLGKDQEASLREQHGARMLTFLFVGLMQALIAILGDLWLLKVYVKEPGLEVLFALIVSFSFMSLIYLLVSLFNNIGKGLAIIILVLSIAAGGGNFPVEMLGKVFQVIHPFLPFTYGVKLLRESTGGIYLPTVISSITFLLATAVISIALSFWLVPYLQKLMYQLDQKTSESGIFH